VWHAPCSPPLFHWSSLILLFSPPYFCRSPARTITQVRLQSVYVYFISVPLSVYGIRGSEMKHGGRKSESCRTCGLVSRFRRRDLHKFGAENNEIGEEKLNGRGEKLPPYFISLPVFRSPYFCRSFIRKGPTHPQVWQDSLLTPAYFHVNTFEMVPLFGRPPPNLGFHFSPPYFILSPNLFL